MHIIQLKGYEALTQDSKPLEFGTWGSYGIEELQLKLDEEWQGLSITVTFTVGRKSLEIKVPEDKIIKVPWEITQKPLDLRNAGSIVFKGTSENLRRFSTNVSFVVKERGPSWGETPPPTPDIWEQYYRELKEMLLNAVPLEGEEGWILTRGEESLNKWKPIEEILAGTIVINGGSAPVEDILNYQEISV